MEYPRAKQRYAVRFRQQQIRATKCLANIGGNLTADRARSHDRDYSGYSVATIAIASGPHPMRALGRISMMLMAGRYTGSIIIIGSAATIAPMLVAG